MESASGVHLLVKIVNSLHINNHPIYLAFPTVHKYKSDFKRDISKLSNRKKVYYHEIKGEHILIFKGDYGSLSKVGYNSKTKARRDIQYRLKDIQLDLDFLNRIYGNFYNSSYFREMENNAQDRHKNNFYKVLKTITNQKNILQNALHMPEISYRSLPLFRKSY